MNLLLNSFRVGDSSDFPTFPPIRLLPCSFRLGDFPDFTTFPKTCLLPFSFRLGDFPGFPTFPPTRLLLSSFRLWNSPGFTTFPPTRLLLLIAKTPGYKPGVSKHILVIIAIQLFHFLFTRVRIVQLQSCLCIITAYTIHDLEY